MGVKFFLHCKGAKIEIQIKATSESYMHQQVRMYTEYCLGVEKNTSSDPSRQ